jgi:hypothetical protein
MPSFCILQVLFSVKLILNLYKTDRNLSTEYVCERGILCVSLLNSSKESLSREMTSIKRGGLIHIISCTCSQTLIVFLLSARCRNYTEYSHPSVSPGTDARLPPIYTKIYKCSKPLWHSICIEPTLILLQTLNHLLVTLYGAQSKCYITFLMLYCLGTDSKEKSAYVPYRCTLIVFKSAGGWIQGDGIRG